MTRKWQSKGTPVPLFDRLCDNTPENTKETPILRKYTKQQTIDSIIREVEAFLNTRSTLSLAEIEELDPLDVGYGIPELFGYAENAPKDPSYPEGADILLEYIETAIHLYEPRLSNVTATLTNFDRQSQSATISIDADLIIGKEKEPLSFPIAIEGYENIAKKQKEQYDQPLRLSFTYES